MLRRKEIQDHLYPSVKFKETVTKATSFEDRATTPDEKGVYQTSV